MLALPGKPLRLWVAALSLCGLASVAKADVKLPAIFGDHMVLQRDQKDKVWGWAEPGEEVTVDDRRPVQDRQGRRRRQVAGRRSTRCPPAARTR